MSSYARRLQYGLLSALMLSGFAAADDVRELTWDDLIPETPTVQPFQPPGGVTGSGGGDTDWDWEEDSFEEAFSTPVYPTGVVEDLDGTQVKLPGFLVPLEITDNGKVSEFLLVPYFGACIHYPAPPPNQIVYVTLPKPREIESMWDPVWVVGEIRTESFQSDLGSAGYAMKAESIDDYEY